MRTDILSWLPDESLLRSDKMSMAAGLEQRVPFLDHRLVEFADRIRFNGHDKLGARMADEVCDRLRLSREEKEAIVWLVLKHLVFMNANLSPWTWNASPKKPASFIIELPIGTIKKNKLKNRQLLRWN